MLKIRLSRVGKKNAPFFRLVLTEHTRSAKHGYLNVLGFYNPITKEFKVKDLEKVKQYVGFGAQLSPRVEKLMNINNIIVK